MEAARSKFFGGIGIGVLAKFPFRSLKKLAAEQVANTTEEEVMNVFRAARDDIEKVVTELLKPNPEHSVP